MPKFGLLKPNLDFKGLRDNSLAFRILLYFGVYKNENVYMRNNAEKLSK